MGRARRRRKRILVLSMMASLMEITLSVSVGPARTERLPDDRQPGSEYGIRRGRSRYANDGEDGEFVEDICRGTRAPGPEIPPTLPIRADEGFE